MYVKSENAKIVSVIKKHHKKYQGSSVWGFLPELNELGKQFKDGQEVAELVDKYGSWIVRIFQSGSSMKVAHGHSDYSLKFELQPDPEEQRKQEEWLQSLGL